MARTTKKTTKRASARKTTARKTTVRKTAARKTAKKATARKTTAKKATARKTTAKKAAVKKTVKISSIKQPFNKSQVLNYLSEATELSKKEVTNIFEALGDLMHHHLKKAGPGEFTVPGLMKCQVKRKPATKARKGINPFTGEPTTFKAKPARNVVKVRPLKKLKEMAE